MLRSMEDQDWFSNDAMTAWGFSWFFRSVLISTRNRLQQGSHLYVFSDWRQTPNVYAIMESCGYRVNHCLVWKKPSFGMGSSWRNQHENIVFASVGKPQEMLNRGKGTVLDCATVSPASRQHPTEKPVELISEIVGVIRADVIADPFMGIGTTLVAAKNANRKAIGIEIEERYCEIAAKRLAQEVLPL